MSTTIGKLAEAGALSFGDGYRTKRSEHGQPGFRILRVADVADGRVSLDGPDFVGERWASQIGPKLSQAGDVLVTTKGTVGRVAIMPEVDQPVVYSPQLCYFRVRRDDVVDPRWLSYWFKSPSFVEQASHRANNTDMAAYINLADIRSLTVPTTPIMEQRAIAEVLGALDDKIAANARLGATAVELVDTMFTRAVRDLHPSDQTFADVATIHGGGTPRTKVDEYWNGDIRWATPTDVTGLGLPYLETTSRLITQAGLEACSSVLHPPGSILMTSRATIGAFAIAQKPTAVNQGFIVVNARDADVQWWLFHEMRSRVPEFLSHANGATFLELSRGKFKNFHVRLARPEVMVAFGERAAALHGRARAASVENAGLAGTRDALLPGLMSGRVRVKDAERAVQEVV